MAARTAKIAIALAAALATAAPAQAESACARTIREAFDHAGRIGAKPQDADLDALHAELRARPTRCAPGDYAKFVRRYADLLIVLGNAGMNAPQQRLAAEVRVLAPQRVPSGDYETSFRAFLDARARLASELPASRSAEPLALLDEVRPIEILPSVALGRDRDGVIQGLAEIRRRLALGQISNADAIAAELLSTLQAESQSADGGAPDAGR